MRRYLFVIIISLLTMAGSAQYNWKLQKDKDNIKVFLSSSVNSNFKAIKVECTLAGNYKKLMAILSDVPEFPDWIYNTKTSRLVKQNTPVDFIYYSETHLPWPMSNRDAVIHMHINTDSLPRFLTITGSNEPTLLPEVSGKVRVPHYTASWKVTMPSFEKIQISYVLEVDPGGSIPAWIANSFADKGPYGTFKNLAERLKQ